MASRSFSNSNFLKILIMGCILTQVVIIITKHIGLRVINNLNLVLYECWPNCMVCQRDLAWTSYQMKIFIQVIIFTITINSFWPDSCTLHFADDFSFLTRRRYLFKWTLIIYWTPRRTLVLLKQIEEKTQNLLFKNPSSIKLLGLSIHPKLIWDQQKMLYQRHTSLNQAYAQLLASRSDMLTYVTVLISDVIHTVHEFFNPSYFHCKFNSSGIN